MPQHASQSKVAGKSAQKEETSSRKSVGVSRSPHTFITHLQRTVGSQAVERLLQSGRLQAKLAISHPGDKYEQEADRVADQVMRMPEPTVQRACAPCAAGGAPCPKCSEEGKNMVQLKAGPSSDTASVLDNFLHGLGSGRPLDSATRAFFEPRFGHDFSQVRVHTDAKAAESARSVNALAYTVGSDVVFGAGQYTPGTQGGQRLLAHELTHVVQQGEYIRPYRPRTAFNFGKTDGGALKEDSFDRKNDKATKPWIELITVKFTSTIIGGDTDGNYPWQGKAYVNYNNNPVKLTDFSSDVTGGSIELGQTDPGSFRVFRIEGAGYNSGPFSGTAGVDYPISDREGPNKRYSKTLNANMHYAVFYNEGEALHLGPLDRGSHGCVHVGTETDMQKINYHSVIGLTKVKVEYS